MSLSQLNQTMANLRMSLAEIQNKEGQLDSMIAQFQTQLRRLPRQVIYGNTPLDVSLSSMGEIEERLDDAIATRRWLLAIKKTANDELMALDSVRQVDDARRSLADLKRQTRINGDGGDPGDIGDAGESMAEIRRLEQFIVEHSKRAEQAITASYEERHSGG